MLFRSFDLSFLNGEFALHGGGNFESHVGNVVDTLVQAKELHPGKRNSLDALCDRYEISNAHRKLHGALLDAELLADVFLAMSRGQNSFSIEIEEDVPPTLVSELSGDELCTEVYVHPVSDAERLEHESLLADINKASNGNGIWCSNAV